MKSKGSVSIIKRTQQSCQVCVTCFREELLFSLFGVGICSYSSLLSKPASEMSVASDFFGTCMKSRVKHGFGLFLLAMP